MEMGSSSSSSSSSHPSDLLNGLKFGHKIYFEDVSIGVPGKSSTEYGSTSAAAVLGLPLPTTAKKGRTGMLQGGQPPRCQVEDCKADLSDAKAYYSRHKVCGMHSKSPKVIVAGLEQRFCQQCSRFHQLLEFDQGKRSCRRRLAGHNERRRKPPPGLLLSSRYGSLSSSVFESKNRTGSFMMDFAAYPSLNERDPWSTTRIPERVSTAMAKFLLNPWQSSLRSPPPNFFLQGSLDKIGYPGPAGIPPGECFTGTPDSSCALSLLSNQSWDSRNQPLSLAMNNPHSADGTHLAHSAGGNGTAIDQYPSTFWAFKGSAASSSSQEMIHPNLGISQMLQPTDSQYPVGVIEVAPESGRQYMELEHPRAYDSSIQHLHWSL